MRVETEAKGERLIDVKLSRFVDLLSLGGEINARLPKTKKRP